MATSIKRMLQVVPVDHLMDISTNLEKLCRNFGTDGLPIGTVGVGTEMMGLTQGILRHVRRSRKSGIVFETLILIRHKGLIISRGGAFVGSRGSFWVQS